MTAVSYGTEGSGAASAREDDGGRSVAGAPALSVAEATAQEAAGRSPICPSCGQNVDQAPHRSNKGSMLICCRGWLAQINADRAKKQS